MRLITLLLLFIVAINVHGQTDTPTESPTAEPTMTSTPDTYRQFELSVMGTPEPARIGLEATVGDVYIANLLTAILFTLWAVIGFIVFVVWRTEWRK